MKINDREKAIDVKKQFGDMLFLNVNDWSDFKTKEVIGVNVIFSSSEYGGREKIVRIKGARKEMFENFKIAEPIEFENTISIDWQFNGKAGTTWYASKVLKLRS